MPSINVHNERGEVLKQETFSDALLHVPVKQSVVHFVVTALQANLRRSTAHTKRRGEVRGGGKKPWRQKGTGRARQGSIRAPQWKGGGVVFGPRNDRNYFQKINKKVKRAALSMSLSDKVARERFILVDALTHADERMPKTKGMVALLAALKIPLRKKNTALVIVPNEAHADRALRNISGVRSVHVESLSVLDCVRYPYIVTTPALVRALEERFLRE